MFSSISQALQSIISHKLRSFLTMLGIIIGIAAIISIISTIKGTNEQIKENFKRLNELGIPVIARTPIISEIEQGIKEISAFLLDMENVIRYELLPYHPLGIEKGRALGKVCARFCVPDREKMEELNKYAFVR